MKKEKKYFIILGIVLLLIASTYYWDNKYVEFRPVILAEENYTRQLLFCDNDLYKFAEPNEVSPNYYKNIRWVLTRSGQPYIEENGIIYVRNRYLNDMNLMWNFTRRTTSPKFFKLEKYMDSINLIHKKEYVDSQRKIIDAYLKALDTTSIK